MTNSKRKPDIYDTIKATPLVEIFAVSIHSDNAEVLKDKCAIYGRIRLTDTLIGTTFHIYDRFRDNPETVSFGDTLLLTPPLDAENAIIIPSKYVSVDVELYDRAHHDTLIAKGCIPLNSTASEDWLEDHQTIVVHGENKLSAKLHYAIYPYAVPAVVRVLFFSADDDFDSTRTVMNFGDERWLMESCDEHDNITYENHHCQTIANLYGVVSAFVPDHGNDGTDPCRSSLLFNKPVEDSVEVLSGRFIELSRSVIAVPAYSSLKIQAVFKDRDTQLPMASGIVEFKPESNSPYKKDIMGHNGSRIRVHVTWSWSDAFDQLYRVIKSENFSPKTAEVYESVGLERLTLGEGPLSPEHSSSSAALSASNALSEDNLSQTLSENCSMSDDDCSETSNYNWLKKQLVEVFSVVVCGKDATPFKFYGSVIVAEPDPEYLVFHSRKSRPQDLPSLGLLAIVGSGGAVRSFPMDGDLGIVVDFKDVSGDIISKGYVSFRGIDIAECGDKHMCSVIRGERGFAAVHYSIIRDGVSATVTIGLTDKNLPSIVKGKIYMRHVSCESSRSYQENLFKTILFSDEDEGAFVYTPCVGMPLVKSIISVPRHSSLIIEADVSFSRDDNDLGRDVEFVKGSVEFTGGRQEEPKKLCNDLYVSVKFFEAED